MSEAQYRFNNGLRYREPSHPNQMQLTPLYVLEPVREALGGIIELDPCTESDNPCGAERFYAPPVNGLLELWDADTILCQLSTAVVFIGGRVKFGVLRANRRQQAASHPSSDLRGSTWEWQ